MAATVARADSVDLGQFGESAPDEVSDIIQGERTLESVVAVRMRPRDLESVEGVAAAHLVQSAR